VCDEQSKFLLDSAGGRWLLSAGSRARASSTRTYVQDVIFCESEGRLLELRPRPKADALTDIGSKFKNSPCRNFVAGHGTYILFRHAMLLDYLRLRIAIFDKLYLYDEEGNPWEFEEDDNKQEDLRKAWKELCELFQPTLDALALPTMKAVQKTLLQLNQQSAAQQTPHHRGIPQKNGQQNLQKQTQQKLSPEEAIQEQRALLEQANQKRQRPAGGAQQSEQPSWKSGDPMEVESNGS
jgi:hypothetical protein